MKIPATVKIGAQRLRVVMVDEATDGNLGLCNVGAGKIFLARKCSGEAVPEDSMVDTFLHELVHSVSITYGIGLKENQVGGVAGGLLQVIRDNKLDFRK